MSSFKARKSSNSLPKKANKSPQKTATQLAENHITENLVSFEV